MEDYSSNSIKQEMDEVEKGDAATTSKWNTTNTGNGRKRKVRSKCWTQFDKLPVGEDGSQYCQCKFCFKRFTCKTDGGTGHLLRHMNKCGNKEAREVGQMFLPSTGGTALSDGSFDPKKFRELLTTAITMHNLPVQFFEFEGVRTLLEYICPGAQQISRSTTEADILKLYKSEKKKIESMLAATPGRISVTAELWTRRNGDDYLSITAHFIDEGWILRKFMLCVSFVPFPYTGATLAEKIYDLLSDWGIIEKLSSMTLGNAPMDDSCAQRFKVKLDSRKALVSGGCLLDISHVLNIIVQEELKEVDDIVENIRNSVRYVRNSQSGKENFLECVKSLGLNIERGLRQDIPKRWDSTFVMLKGVIYYKTAFQKLGMDDSGYIWCPSMLEWAKVEKLCEFLKSFYDLAFLFSGTKYPTSNMFFPSMVLIYHKLIIECGNEDDSIKEMATRIFGKFEKYWSNFNETLAMAVVLDPCYKFQFVEWVYRKLYGDNGRVHIMNVRRKLFDLFGEYSQSSSSTLRSSPHVSQSGSNPEPLEGDVELQGRFKTFLSEFETAYPSDTGMQKSELELYLEEKRISRTEELDVLQYWSKHALRHPIISSMARDLLCIPITTIAPQSAFSYSGRIVDCFHRDITSGHVEALLCVRDWAGGETGLEEAIELYESYTEDILLSNGDEENSSE